MFRYQEEEYVLMASPSLLLAEGQPGKVVFGKGGLGEESRIFWAIQVIASIQ